MPVNPKPYVNATVAYHIQDGRTKPAKISALNPDADDVVDLVMVDGSGPQTGVKYGDSEGQWSWPASGTGA